MLHFLPKDTLDYHNIQNALFVRALQTSVYRGERERLLHSKINDCKLADFLCVTVGRLVNTNVLPGPPFALSQYPRRVTVLNSGQAP